ncbi:MAG: hypothetical protein MUD11_11625 [Rhodobacteraceae bacterium]|jgi:hypothetical protein|nr:hypothetical protein [Paracoccaceae bacterium]
MKRFLVFMAFATPAVAQDLTTDQCNALLQAVPPALAAIDVDTAPIPSATAAAGWCEIDSWEYRPDAAYAPGFRVATLRFRGDGLPDALSGAPPSRLEVQARDMLVRVYTEDPAMNYLMDVQGAQAGIDLDLVLTYDAGARRLVMERLALDFPGDNAINLSAELVRLDLTSAAGLQLSVGQAGITRLNLDISSHGLFENYVVLPLGLPLLNMAGPGEPEAVVAGLIADARGTIAALPDTLMDANSRAALDLLLADMPHPWGKLTLDIAVPAGFGAPRFMGFAMTGVPFTLQGWMPVFDGVTFNATYNPSPKED